MHDKMQLVSFFLQLVSVSKSWHIYRVVPLTDACDSAPGPYVMAHFVVNDEAVHSLAFVASCVPVDLEL